jgi:hypothetical protein
MLLDNKQYLLEEEIIQHKILKWNVVIMQSLFPCW